MRGSGKKRILFLVGVARRRGGFPLAAAARGRGFRGGGLAFPTRGVGGGSNGQKIEAFPAGAGSWKDSRRAKKGSFSSARFLPARDDENGRKKLILIEPTIGWTVDSSGPTLVQYHSGPIGRTGPETWLAGDRTEPKPWLTGQSGPVFKTMVIIVKLTMTSTNKGKNK